MAALGESELIGVLCAAARMEALAAAQKTEAIITLARRRTAQARERKNLHLAEHVGDEIAAALTLTGRSADPAAGGRREPRPPARRPRRAAGRAHRPGPRRGLR